VVTSSSLVGETLGSSWHLRHHPPLTEIQNMPLPTTSYKNSKEEESMSVPYTVVITHNRFYSCRQLLLQKNKNYSKTPR